MYKPVLRKSAGVRAVCVAAAAVFALSSCAQQLNSGPPLSDADLGDAATVDALDELYEAAIENGEESIVTYGPGEDRYKPAYAAFMRRYPEIQVLPEYTFGADLATRLNQEFGSGNHVGAMVNGGATITLLASGSDRCQSYEPFTATELDEEVVGPDHTFHGFTRWIYGFAYNPDTVDAADVPASWGDLTDPEWSGRLALTDPTTVSDSSVTIAAMLYSGDYDETWLREIAANNPTILANSQLAIQAVASGQDDISTILSYNSVKRLQEKDLPIQFVAPEGAARIESLYTCMLKDNPAPNASKLLLNWMFTEEGQRALAGTGGYSIFRDGPAPEGMRPTAEVLETALEEVPLSVYRDETAETIELTKSIFR